MGAEDSGEAEEPAGTARCRDRSADTRHDADAFDRPRHGLPLRHSAAADRRHALRRLRATAGRAIFHADQHLRSRSRKFCPNCRAIPRPSTGSMSRSPTTGQWCRWRLSRNGRRSRSRPCRSATRANFRRSRSVSISLRASRSARPRRRSRTRKRDLRCRRALTTTFQGKAQAFQDSLTTVPLLILAALVVVYLILGMLYESFIHPLTILSTLPSAGFGALATLMFFGFDFSLIAFIGFILLIGIVKKNGIMMVDFAIAAERDEHVAGAIDPEGRAAALSPDHDDDDGRDVRRRAADARARHRVGTTPAARLCDGRRPALQPGPDLVHDAGHLSLSRSPLPMALRARPSVRQPPRRSKATKFANWTSRRPRAAE